MRPNLKQEIIDSIIRQALREDRVNRDITSRFIFPQDRIVRAEIIAKEIGIIAGLEVVGRLFYLMDKKIKFRKLTRDGEWVKRGERVATLEGSLKKILAGERTALNFLMRLSGIATQTRQFVQAVYPYRVKIMDTRKTTPGLRALEKYAVRVGGGVNHRMDLSEGVLIKDNHLRKIKNPAKGLLRLRSEASEARHRRQKSKIKNLIEGIREKISKNMEIEIEVKNLREFRQALEAEPDVIMLDNMGLEEIKKAVKIRNQLSAISHQPLPKLEVSGGISLKDVRSIARRGVERISIGSLTHSFKSLDFSLEIT